MAIIGLDSIQVRLYGGIGNNPIIMNAGEVRIVDRRDRKNPPTPIRKKKNEVDLISPMPLEDLQTIIDSMNKYKIDRSKPEHFEELGRGHFGTVFGYKGYAIKFVKGGQSSYDGYGSSNGEGEIEDAKVLRKLQCVPSIPRLYATIDNEIIIMEKVDGMTLAQYRDQMEDADKMDNFIHVDFINIYKDIMRDILMAGMLVSDLHMDNVMVDKRTGFPRVIDVGLFSDMNEHQEEIRGNSKEGIYFDDFYNVKDAIDYVKRMKSYIDEKKFPQLLEERKAEILEEREIRKQFKIKRDARKEKEAKERGQRRYERRARYGQSYKARGGFINMVGINNDNWGAGLARAKTPSHCHRPDFHHWAMGVGGHINAGIIAGNVASIQAVKFDERPKTIPEVVEVKFENKFKNGLHEMLRTKGHARMRNNMKHLQQMR